MIREICTNKYFSCILTYMSLGLLHFSMTVMRQLGHLLVELQLVLKNTLNDCDLHLIS